jgi:hypothetical protein
MSTELTMTITPPIDDGFDHRDGSPPRAGAIYTKFDGSTSSVWFDRAGPALSKRGPYACVACQTEAVKWLTSV